MRAGVWLRIVTTLQYLCVQQANPSPGMAVSSTSCIVHVASYLILVSIVDSMFIPGHQKFITVGVGMKLGFSFNIYTMLLVSIALIQYTVFTSVVYVSLI